MYKIIIFSIIILFSFSSCLKDAEFTCNYNACTMKAPADQIAEIKNYLTTNNITAEEHCSGLFYSIENPGTGKNPTTCHTVYVTYTGMLLDGSVFDSNNTGIALTLTQVIVGWANAVPLLKPGGKMRMYIPPALGYGSQALPGIPPNSILVFDVELIAVL